MIIPPQLQKNDKIGLISTARKISLEELTPAIKILKGWELDVVFGNNLFREDNQFSGTIEQRSSDLQSMIDDNSIKTILCVRGGYGTVQIIDSIDFSNLVYNPKWIVGYSDITVLHSHLNNLGIASLHATMPINFSNNTIGTLNSLKKFLFESSSLIDIKPHRFNTIGETTAEIVGGNLSVLYSLIGSKSDINTKGKILFIEDIDEYLYHIDRMMMNLKRNEKFDKLSGLIVGGMSDMNDNKLSFGKTAEEIIFEHLKDYNFPICFDFPAGHLDDNNTIVFGVKSWIKISDKKVVLSSPISNLS